MADLEPRLADDGLAVLADLSQALAQSLDIDQTLREAVSRIGQHLAAEAASLFMLDGETQRLCCRACYGPVDIVGLSIPVGQGVVGHVFSEGRARLVADAANDQDFTGQVDARTGFVTRTLACAPIIGADGPVGVLQVLNKTGNRLFEARDLATLRLLAAPTALAIGNARLAGALLEQERIRREFQLARRLQRSLLPRRNRQNFPLIGVNVPAREISGDFFDFFELADGRIAFTAGDVSGKGMDAALLMVRCSSLLRWAGKSGLAPAEWLARTNTELCESASRGMFVCAVVGYYQPADGVVEFANAGFPPVLHRDVDGQYTRYAADGPPLGILDEMVYSEQRLRLLGGSLYCFSDGVTDARESASQDSRELIGLGGVERLIDEYAGRPPQARLRTLVERLRRMALHDDVTIVLVEDRRRIQDRPLVELGFGTDPANLATVRRAVQDAISDLGLDQRTRQALVLVVDEACANVIRHAYGGCPDGRAVLDLSIEGGELLIRLRDWAPTVNPDCVQPKALGECRAGGFGVALINEVMDGWRLAPGPHGIGNVLEMRKALPGLELTDESSEDPD